MDSAKFFELVRNSAYAIAFCVLLPFFAHYTARLFIGPVTANYWKQISAINAQISATKEKENALTKELAKKPNELVTNQFEAVKKELQELSEKLAAVEAEEKQDEVRKGRITFYIAAIVGLLSLFFGSIASANYLAAGATLGGTICLILGYSAHWGQLTDFLKAFSLFFALIIIAATSFRMSKR